MSLREKLAAETALVSWPHLAPHFERGAMLLCPGVPLLDVAVALAEDDAAQVGAWLATGSLRRPGSPEAEAWAEAGATFEILIVQPFVVAREVPEVA